ncbi:YraN family protein [Alkalilimnicola sp. S0819]|uniref:YraN family protein n=1 Tax=Alkalilimnicola sp. S0819 TaxID=2613922 RepID=UPI001262099F|nr:YraN family protein [Alkalilimnicola sp. S0819]KAB7623845.1 YraN family protein [Alkalilimnicola sp. S0819]MPQ16721.1 YraN family protein [Alkalilimnicola sp. S0819]
MSRLRLWKGQRAESQAEQHLSGQGLHLIERNYRCRMGELDLIMRDGAVLVFVEVRCRAHARYGSGADSVDLRKRRKLARAAAHYLQNRRLDLPCRFDVVSINGAGALDWIPQAFSLNDT